MPVKLQPFLFHRSHFLFLPSWRLHGYVQQPYRYPGLHPPGSSHIPVLHLLWIQKSLLAWMNSIFQGLRGFCIHLKILHNLRSGIRWFQNQLPLYPLLPSHTLYRLHLPSVPVLHLLYKKGYQYELHQLPWRQSRIQDQSVRSYRPLLSYLCICSGIRLLLKMRSVWYILLLHQQSYQDHYRWISKSSLPGLQ